RDVGRHGFALGRKAERRMVGAADPAAAIDEGIEHHVQELVGELEGDLLRAGRGLAGKMVQSNYARGTARYSLKSVTSRSSGLFLTTLYSVINYAVLSSASLPCRNDRIELAGARQAQAVRKVDGRMRKHHQVREGQIVWVIEGPFTGFQG